MRYFPSETELNAALASAAKDYAKKRTEENHHVMIGLLERGYNEGTPLFMPYSPSNNDNALHYKTANLKGRSFLLCFTHSEDMLDTEFVSATQTDVAAILNYLHEHLNEHSLSGIAFHTGTECFPCLVSIHDCLQIAEKYHSIYAAVQSHNLTARLANMMHLHPGF